MNSESQETIQDFLTLLDRESQNANSSLLTQTEWQALGKLIETLKISEDSTPVLANAILDWCEQYPPIANSLNGENWSKIRINMAKNIPTKPPEGERPININNKALLIEKIEEIKNKKQKRSQ